MKKRILQYIFLSCSLIILFSSCRKDPFNGKETLQSGKTFVWIDGAPQNSNFFDVFTDIKQVPMFIVRRDAASTADLQKAVTVTLTAINIDTLNAHRGTHYTQMPTSVYTVDPEKGMTYTPESIKFDFAAGDFAKQVKFEIDGSKLDLSKTYAVAFVITNFGGFTKKVGLDTILATVAVKNKYEGTYAVTGSIFRYDDPTMTTFDGALSGSFVDGVTTYLATVAPNANSFTQYWKDGSGVAGIAGTYLTVDPLTNKVTVASTGNATMHNLAGQDNYYDPDTKTFHLNFIWGANPRVAHDVLTYVGP
jgi:hypothetical protein